MKKTQRLEAFSTIQLESLLFHHLNAAEKTRTTRIEMEAAIKNSCGSCGVIQKSDMQGVAERMENRGKLFRPLPFASPTHEKSTRLLKKTFPIFSEIWILSAIFHTPEKKLYLHAIPEKEKRKRLDEKEGEKGEAQCFGAWSCLTSTKTLERRAEIKVHTRNCSNTTDVNKKLKPSSGPALPNASSSSTLPTPRWESIEILRNFSSSQAAFLHKASFNFLRILFDCLWTEPCV